MQKQIQLKDGTPATLTVTELPVGDAGVVQSLTVMIKFALEAKNDAKIQELAAQLRGGTDVETITNTYRYVVRTFPYVKDPDDSEFLTHPKHIIRKRSPYGYLDCDDLSMVLASLLLANGFRVGYRVIAWRRQDYTHVFPIVFHSNQWRPLDPVMKEKGLFNQRPAKFRQSDVEIKSGAVPTLNDGETPAIDWDKFKNDLLAAIIKPGGDPMEVVKAQVADICEQGIKQKIQENKGKIIAGSIAAVLILGATGYGVGKAIEKANR